MDAQLSSIPSTLQSRNRWICWRRGDRNGKKTKIPVSPTKSGAASVDDPETWSDFKTAHTYAELNDVVSGIGFVFTTHGPFVGVDLDDCRDPTTGDLDNWASEIVQTIDSYTEVSPSGTGVHIIARGGHPGSLNRTDQIEVYDSDRYFTMTGDHIGNHTSIESREDELTNVYKKHIASSNRNDSTSDGDSSVSVDTNGCECTAPHTSRDEELLQKAGSAANGELFESLWNGDTTLWGEGRKYESQSEADLAFCNILAFWTGRDSTWIDHLFRQSDLMRPKWDEVHYADGTTYGERVIEKAICEVDDTYSGSINTAGGSQVVRGLSPR